MKFASTSLVVLFVCVFNLTTFSQYATIGLIGGGGVSTLKSELFESSFRPGYILGFSFLGYYSEEFQLISEFTFESSGAKTIGLEEIPADNSFSDPTYEEAEEDMFFSTVGWNLVGNYFFTDYIAVQGGAHLGLINKSKDAFGNTELYYGYPENEITSSNVRQSLRNLDYGLTVGLAGGTEDFIVSLRYYYGLRKHEVSSPFSMQSESIQRNAIQLSLTYIFKNVRVEMGE